MKNLTPDHEYLKCEGCVHSQPYSITTTMYVLTILTALIHNNDDDSTASGFPGSTGGHICQGTFTFGILKKTENITSFGHLPSKYAHFALIKNSCSPSSTIILKLSTTEKATSYPITRDFTPLGPTCWCWRMTSQVVRQWTKEL